MALSIKAGNFTTVTGTVPFDQGVTGVGFTPKAIILFCTRQTATGFATDQSTAFGFASGSAAGNQRCAAFYSLDNFTPTNSRGSWDDDVIRTIVLSSQGSVGALKSFDADGFTITWKNFNPGNGIIIGYLALGGTDLTNVAVTEHTMQAGTGNKSYTGVGFQPDAMILLTGQDTVVTADNTTTADCKLCIGAAKSTTKRWAFATTARDAQNMTANVDANKTQLSAQCFFGLDTAAPSVEFDWDFVQFDSDGFTVNQVTASATLYLFASLCFKGLQTAVEVFGKPTGGAGSTNDVAVGFSPLGVLNLSFNNIASTSVIADCEVSIGASDFTNEACTWSQEKDATINTEANMAITTTKGMQLNESVSTTNSEADLTASGNNVRYTWTTNDAVAQQVCVMAFGNAPAAPATVLKDPILKGMVPWKR